MKFFNGEPKRKSQPLIWVSLKNLFTTTPPPYLLKTEELEKAVEERTLELELVNRKLNFQNKERGKRAAELIIANEELAFQNGEKEKRAAELMIANLELVYQNDEKEKRAAELIAMNAELEAFNYISSHDLQEPLRKITLLANIILETESKNLSEKGRDYFNRIQSSASRMQQLIKDLLAFSHLNDTERKFELVAIQSIVEQVKEELRETIEEKNATVTVTELCEINIILFQFHQVMHNLIGNALKFSRPGHALQIVIKSKIIKGIDASELLSPHKEYCHLSISDNGIGFDEQDKDQIFEVFKRLHHRKLYPGTGIGLAIVKKVIDNHHGRITATSKVNEGSTFHIYIPVRQ